MNRKRLFLNGAALIAAMTLLLYIMGCSDKVGTPTGPSSGTTGIVSGYVRDSTTNAGIPGAFVDLYSYADTVLRDSVTTNDSGFYKIGNIPPGLYWIAIDANNYSNIFVDTIRFQAGSNISWNVRLEKSSPSGGNTGVSLHVEDAVTRQPIPTATITLDGTPSGGVDLNGDSFIGFAFMGDHTIGVSAPGYLSSTSTVYLTQGVEIYDTVALSQHFDTLLCQYMFNGSAIDSSGNGHNGTLHGCTFGYDRFGIANSAIQLNGSTDYISIPNSADLNFGQAKSLSLCFWTKCQEQNPSQETRYIIRKADSSTGSIVGYNVENANYNFISFCSTTAGMAQSLGEEIDQDNMWHFIVYVYDGSGTVSSYFDGNGPDDVQTGINLTHALKGPMPNASPLLIGSDGSAGHAFKGMLDDIRIYQGALQPGDVNALYHLNGW